MELVLQVILDSNWQGLISVIFTATRIGFVQDPLRNYAMAIDDMCLTLISSSSGTRCYRGQALDPSPNIMQVAPLQMYRSVWPSVTSAGLDYSV